MSVTDSEYFGIVDGTRLGEVILVINIPDNDYSKTNGYFKFVAKYLNDIKEGSLIMRTIENLIELQVNMKTLDKYITSKKDPEYGYGLDLVKKGTCFVAVKENNTYKFYPSRFIGYFGNSMNAHQNNEYKNGRETNPAISKILGGKPKPNNILDNLYKKYCESLGFIANEKGTFGVERKYW